jgi:hypothetical protein
MQRKANPPSKFASLGLTPHWHARTIEPKGRHRFAIPMSSAEPRRIPGEAKATVLGPQSWSWDCSRSWTASEAMAKATREREGMDAGIGAKATVLDCMVGDCEGICASLQA